MLSLLFGLFEFSIEKYPEAGDGLREALLPRDSTEDGEAGNEEEVLDAQVEVSANPYPFHWCTGLLFCLYALLLNRMIGSCAGGTWRAWVCVTEE